MSAELLRLERELNRASGNLKRSKDPAKRRKWMEVADSLFQQSLPLRAPRPVAPDPARIIPLPRRSFRPGGEVPLLDTSHHVVSPGSWIPCIDRLWGGEVLPKPTLSQYEQDWS